VKEEVKDLSDPTKRTKKVKSKVAAKSGGSKYQWQIMQSLGMKDDEIVQWVWLWVYVGVAVVPVDVVVGYVNGRG